MGITNVDLNLSCFELRVCSIRKRSGLEIRIGDVAVESNN